MKKENDHDMMNKDPKKMPDMAQMMQQMMPDKKPKMMPDMAQMMQQMMMPGMQPMMMPEMAQMMPMMPGCMPMHQPMHCMPMHEHMHQPMYCMPMHEHMPCHPCGHMMPGMVAGEYAEHYADHEEVEPEDVDYLEDLNEAYPELSKECKECLKQLMAIDFVLVELNLYLDTHPMDRRAIAEHNRYLCMRKPLVKKVEECYGPLIHKTEAGYPWAWLNQPWPWRIEF